MRLVLLRYRGRFGLHKYASTPLRKVTTVRDQKTETQSDYESLKRVENCGTAERFHTIINFKQQLSFPVLIAERHLFTSSQPSVMRAFDERKRFRFIYESTYHL